MITLIVICLTSMAVFYLGYWIGNHVGYTDGVIDVCILRDTQKPTKRLSQFTKAIGGPDLETAMEAIDEAVGELRGTK